MSYRYTSVWEYNGIHANDATQLFEQLGVKLSFTVAYNLDADGKIQYEHNPKVKVIVKSSEGRVGYWPRLLPYALWVVRITHSSLIEYMPTELMHGQKPILLDFFMGK